MYLREPEVASELQGCTENSEALCNIALGYGLAAVDIREFEVAPDRFFLVQNNEGDVLWLELGDSFATAAKMLYAMAPNFIHEIHERGITDEDEMYDIEMRFWAELEEFANWETEMESEEREAKEIQLRARTQREFQMEIERLGLDTQTVPWDGVVGIH